MKRKLLYLLIIMAVAGVFGTTMILLINKNPGKETGKEVSEINLVTSFYPTYIIGMNIVDQVPGIRLESLTDFKAGCLHDYQLTTGDMRLLSDADVFIMNGGGMESYIGDVVKNYPDLSMINISEGIAMLDSGENAGEQNSHVWLDPKRYLLQIANMKDGLVQYINGRRDLSEENRSEIIQKLTDNAEAYIDKVNGLETELETVIQGIEGNRASENRSVIIFHEAFAYLAERAGLTVTHTIEVEGDTAFSAGEIAEMIRQVNEGNIRYLFTEKQYGNSITDRIVEETDAKSYVIDSAVTGDGTKDSYLHSMEKNLQTLKEVFE
jgi:zinc transport system substrate-binding protein